MPKMKRLGFTSQISMGIENAKLFDDVQNQKTIPKDLLACMMQFWPLRKRIIKLVIVG